MAKSTEKDRTGGSTRGDASATEKRYYRIGEVSRITDVKPYVLRYWEGEFDELSVPKTRSGQRMYRRRDIARFLRIRKLLHD